MMRKEFLEYVEKGDTDIMAQIKPFQCIRPKADLAERIAALPYDVFNSQESRAEVEKEPLSFLKIDRAETQFPEEVDIYDDKVYQRAHDTLWQMVEDGSFVEDPDEVYYIYELTMDGRVQTGLVGCASIDDYLNGIIMKHENTRSEKEEDRIRHVETCGAQTGPIFLSYRKNEVIQNTLEEVKQQAPLYDFVSADGIRHTVWKILDASQNDRIRDTLSSIQQIYIADGHHRAASAVKVGLKKRAENPGYTGQEEFNYFLSVLFPSDQLYVMDYNRVVKDLNGNTTDGFMEKIKAHFDVRKMETEAPYRPTRKGEMGMYLGKTWYCLNAREIPSGNPVDSLDVAILQDTVLAPILNIQDPKTDDRIFFIGGIRGLDEVAEETDRFDCGVAFTMYPTAMDELFAVADAGLLMPPKSTWFEPKLRSGIFIHKI